MSSPATPTTPPPTPRRRRAVTVAGGEEGKSGEGREEGEEAGGGYFGNMASCLVRYSPNMPFSVPIFSFSFNIFFGGGKCAEFLGHVSSTHVVRCHCA